MLEAPLLRIEPGNAVAYRSRRRCALVAQLPARCTQHTAKDSFKGASVVRHRRLSAQIGQERAFRSGRFGVV
jgi:hypothetical protein